MKILMAYYTPEEGDALIASRLQEKLSCRSEEIMTAVKFTRLKELWHKATGTKPEIIPTFNNPGSYDLTVICFSKYSPRLPLPVAAYIQKQRERLKNSFYLAISGTLNEDSKGLEEYIRLAGEYPVGMAELSRQEPLLSQKVDELAGRINEFSNLKENFPKNN